MKRIEDILYPRQIEVLEILALGGTTKDVAMTLKISVKTAEHHRAEIYHALNIHDPIMLVHFAIYHKIVPLIRIAMPKKRKPTRRAHHCMHEAVYYRRRRETCGSDKIVNPLGEAV